MLILTKPGLPSLPLAADSLPCFWLILTSTTLPYLEKSFTRSSLLQLCGRLPTNSCWLSLKYYNIESCIFCEAFKTTQDKLALLWDEAQLCLLFALCLLKERKIKKRIRVTYSDPIVTYSHPKITFTILKMT